MTTVGVLSFLRGQGAKLWVDGDRLRFSAAPGIITPELRTQLAARKAEILDLLRQSQPCDSALPTLEPASRNEPLPLSFAQQRLWFLEQFAPGNPFYCESA